VNNLIHTANTSGTAQTAYSGTQIIKVDSIEDLGPKLTLTINMIRANDINGDFIKFVKLGDRESNGEFLKDYILHYPITIEE
jgi:hypothetical protein